MDVGDDSGANGVWMTYGEIAIARGIKRVAAIRLVQRHKWRKQAGNDGLARVLVPPEWAKPGDRAPRDIAPDVAGDVVPDDMGDVARVISALETSVASLTERAEAAERRADKAESRADRAEEGRAAADARASRLDQALADERARADALRDRVDAMQTTAQTAETRAAVLRDRLDAMQTQLAEAHAALQAATETERRAAQAEEGREAERSRADALRDRLDGLQAQLAAAERASADLQAARTRAAERVGRAENDVFELKGQLAAAQTNAEQAAREATQEARRAALAILQEEDAARRRLGVVARLRAAWRGG